MPTLTFWLRYFVILFFIVAISCKKESQEPPPAPVAHCTINDHALGTKLPFTKPNPYAVEIEVWEDGWLVLLDKSRDSVYIFDPGLKLQTAWGVPKVEGIKCLSDHTLLTIYSETTAAVVAGGAGVSGWLDVGLNENCERTYAYAEMPFSTIAQQGFTHITAYDRSGNSLFQTQLEGYSTTGKQAQVVAELNGGIHIGLIQMDTIKYSLVKDSLGVYQDTIARNTDDGTLWLYQLDYQGHVLHRQKKEADLPVYHLANEARMVASEGYLWYSSRGKIVKLDPSHTASDEIWNPGAMCGEEIYNFYPYPGGVLIRSRQKSTNTPLVYALNTSWQSSNIMLPQQSNVVGTLDDAIYLVSEQKLIKAGTSTDIIWEATSGTEVIFPSSVTLGCNGSFYGLLSKKESNQFEIYLLKINPRGELVISP